jgi:fibro-slime domain-containing protein
LALLLRAASCGARSELSIPDVTCDVEGSQRACADGCGSGAQTCAGGLWSECVVPMKTRVCSDGCADGEERCEGGAWQPCVAPLVQRVCSSVCGDGHETCRAGVWGACDAPQPKPPQLSATVRDFSDAHPDFEELFKPGVDLNIVEDLLGPDDKPVYRSSSTTQSTSGKQNFDQWYRDTPVNWAKPLPLPLTPSNAFPGAFEYDDQTFFPIDNDLFGNEGRRHNYHFTLEASTRFKYHGGEVFSFVGDDDMWVFVNRRLAIDLGGLHPSRPGEVKLDLIAGSHGLEIGGEYPLHFFFAERHTSDSTFMIRTTIAEPGSCD